MALSAIRRLMADPQDTTQVAVLEVAMGGCSPREIFQRFVMTPHGQRVLREKRSLVDALSDHARLRLMPENSLGRAYLAFVQAAGFSAEGLMDTTDAYTAYLADKPEAVRIFSDYTQRGAHDLYHVLGGYGRDELGETCVVAMAYQQIRVRGYTVIATLAPMVIHRHLRRAGIGGRGILAAVRQAVQTGRTAEWLPGVDLEAALPMDIDDLRSKLRIPSPSHYDAVIRRARNHPGWKGGPFAQLAQAAG
jgi:ubiquinone biosynthesis protein COQ4